MIMFPRKKLFLLILAALLALAALSAETFVFTHLDHDCVGADCPVCLQIEIAQNVLKGLGIAFVAASLAGFTLHINGKVRKASFFIRLFTPVALNIKSNT